MYKLNEINDFQQEVNYQIERNGGLTEEAMTVLNDRAKLLYGGCLISKVNDEEGAVPTCIYQKDIDAGVAHSGFFIREFKTESDGKMTYYDRGSGADAQARYGTKIEYVIARQIGNIGGKSVINPMKLGSSASRVRGQDPAAE